MAFAILFFPLTPEAAKQKKRYNALPLYSPSVPPKRGSETAITLFHFSLFLNTKTQINN
jgi:hypothetical protein